MTPNHSATTEPKAALRRAVLSLRRKIHKSRASSSEQTLKARLYAELGGAGKIIAGYWPIGDEINCRPAIEKFASEGLQVVLPVVAGQGQVLIFRVWNPGEDLETGPFGTSHPGNGSAVRTPDVMLLPLVAFDNKGQRLGYGAGYYDRTIAALRASGKILAVGVGYDEQEIEHIPADDHDQVMDAVITDRRTIWFDQDEPGT
jgi:5-formyltetrahydrofolate cyclo-ligase